MTDEESDENDSSGQKTKIDASLSSLEVTVETEGKEECEELFYNVWGFIVDDAEDMSDAMRDRLSGP